MARQTNGDIPPKVSIISEGTTFEGTLVSSSDIRVSGYVKGSVETAEKLVVPQSGRIEGTIKGASLSIGGHIKGAIVASGNLLLQKTAVVEANMQVGRLIVEEGAVFNGECRTGKQVINGSDISSAAAKPARPAPVRK